MLPPPRQRLSNLERSGELQGGQCRDVDDLRRFSRLSRRMRMRLTNYNHQKQTLHNFKRHAVQRRSMPEIQKADLVYLRGPSKEENGMMDEHVYRSEERLNFDWKPRTEFERSYFGDIHDYPRPSSSLNYYECNDQHLLKEMNDNNRRNENGREFDQNSNLIGLETSKKTLIYDDIDPAEIPRRIDDYVVPHSPEFRTSRERLHEIFEYNRYLRRKFFAELPSGGNNNNTQQQLSVKLQPTTPRRNTDYPKTGLGFGSTETLTSQSNQSAGSSTDGRKSRADFGNTPESLDFDHSKNEQKVTSLPLTYFGTDRNGGTWRSATNRLSANMEHRLKSHPTDLAKTQKGTTTSEVWDEASKSFVDTNKERDFRKSLPNLTASGSPSSITRLSLEESAVDLIGNSCKKYNGEVEKSPKTEKEDNENKYFASYVRVTDSSEDSKNTSPVATMQRGRTNIPPALDLATVRRKHSSCDELERNFLQNYRDTEDVQPFRESWTGAEIDTKIERSRQYLLKNSHSLLELSTNPPSISPPRNRRETRIERMIRRRGQSSFNKSCSDLMTVEDYSSRLLSPRLVCNALCASRERMLEEMETDKRKASRRPTIARTTPEITAGTTLPSVYGPIPYS